MTERDSARRDRLPGPSAGPSRPANGPAKQDSLLWLQQSAGNAAVGELLSRQMDTVQRAPATPAAAKPAAAKPPPAKVNHATGVEVDKFLLANSVLKPYVEPKMKGGTKSETSVKIQNAADFKKDWVAYAMTRQNSATGATYTKAEAEAEEPDINAFTDEPTIHVHENRGERATTIHETMHLFQDNTFYAATGFNISEGMTETFTRLVTTEQKITRGNFYPDQRGSIAKLVLASSVEKVADAYFNNKPDDLKKDVEAKGAGTWDKWVTAMKGGQYSKADELLK